MRFFAARIAASWVFAQEGSDFGKISFENGYFVYHGLKFESVNFGSVMLNVRGSGLGAAYDITAKDTSELSYVDNGNGGMLVFKKKDGWVIELPLRFFYVIEYNVNSKAIALF